MKGITVPERTEDFTADPVELFFDLAFVYAYSQLVGVLVHDPDWVHVGRAGLLFALLWLPWSQFTWSANAVSGNGRMVRTLFLVATAISVPMAASVSTAFDDGGPVFALCLGAITVIGMSVQLLSEDLGEGERAAIARWISIGIGAIALLVAGSFVDDGLRIALWCGSAAVVLGAMILAGRGEWVVRPGHFAERHGLIIIVALGEVIVAIGLAVVSSLEEGAGLPAETIIALAASGAFACLLWWGYFDRPARALEHRAESIEGGQALGRYVRDVYTWAHAPLVAGIILAAAALEEITLHPSDALAVEFRTMLIGGLALTIVGVGGAIWRAFRAVAKERLACGVVLVALAAAAGDLDGVWLLVLVDLVILVTLLVEHRRIER